MTQHSDAGKARTWSQVKHISTEPLRSLRGIEEIMT